MTIPDAQPSWPQLLRVALLGTRQNGEPVPAVLPADTTRPEDREQQVLLSAGALALMRRAGYQPAAAAPAPVPAPPETLPPLGQMGTACLRQMVVDSLHLDLLPDYLRQVAAAGRRVPAGLLAPLLRHAASSPETTAVLAPVVGVRGQWLAALNPE